MIKTVKRTPNCTATRDTSVVDLVKSSVARGFKGPSIRSAKAVVVLLAFCTMDGTSLG